MADYLTQTDLDNYGSDLVDFSQRAAAHASSPQLQYLEAQNVSLQQQLAREARHRVDAALAEAVPNYREVDQDPAWHAWLRQVDPLNGVSRQVLLDRAVAAADANR